MLAYKQYFFDRIYSPDDGGWYVEVIERSGATAHITDIYPDSHKAIRSAEKWVAWYEQQNDQNRHK